MKIRYKSWGGVREESKVIKYFADKWCRDNGYPIKNRKWVNKSGPKSVQNVLEKRQGQNLYMYGKKNKKK